MFAELHRGGSENGNLLLVRRRLGCGEKGFFPPRLPPFTAGQSCGLARGRISAPLKRWWCETTAFDATRRRCLSRSVTSSPIICCRRAVRAFLSRCSRNSLRFSLSTCSMPAGTASPCDESGVIDCSSGLSRAPNRRCALLGPGRGGTGPENACCMIGRSPLRSAARPCAN